MVARPQECTSQAFVRPAVIADGQTATIGRPLKRNSDGTFQTATAGQRVAGWPLEDGVAGQTISYYVPNHATIIPVKVGTGGTATPGKFAQVGTAGVTDEPSLGGGNTSVELCGEFQDAGTDGDLVGLLIFHALSVKA